MAADSAAAKRYAQAAFDLAVEGNAVTAWRSDIEDIAQVLADSGLAGWLADANVPLEERLAAVERVLVLQPLAMNFAKLLVTRQRAGEARSIATAFNALADAHEGVEDAVITTAVPLDAAQQETIEKQIAAAIGKRIRLTTRVDPTLVGGLVIRVGDQLIDGSIRAKLRIMRRQLEGAI